jgi:endonuclease/exonuclease/phosphatase family metal-dependent hydrolase
MPIVASYNIHGCVGRDRRLAPERIAAVIRELDADVVALQEVDAQHHVDGYLDQWVFLAETLGYHCVPGISLRTHRRDYGNAVLVRTPPASVRLHDLSVAGREPRGAIDLDIELDGSPLRIIATHLGLGAVERRAQIDHLLGVLAEEPDRRATILLGDLNEWFPASRNLRRLGARFHVGPAPASFPARHPVLALDRILAAGNAQVAAPAAHRSPLARIASDHLPVRATLQCREGG